VEGEYIRAVSLGETLEGSILGDRIIGNAGQDIIRGLSGDDCLEGGGSAPMSMPANRTVSPSTSPAGVPMKSTAW
jgi:hypothetical protein